MWFSKLYTCSRLPGRKANKLIRYAPAKIPDTIFQLLETLMLSNNSPANSAMRLTENNFLSLIDAL